MKILFSLLGYAIPLIKTLCSTCIETNFCIIQTLFKEMYNSFYTYPQKLEKKSHRSNFPKFYFPALSILVTKLSFTLHVILTDCCFEFEEMTGFTA